jgi:exoribonuclease R
MKKPNRKARAIKQRKTEKRNRNNKRKMEAKKQSVNERNNAIAARKERLFEEYRKMLIQQFEASQKGG